MYVIKLDGDILYSPAMYGNAYNALTPKLSLDINGAGSLSFVLLKSNRKYDAIRRLKSIVTVEQDGQEIFRGRVLDRETDTYRQKSVYCEGARAYLMDSQAAPYSFTGTARRLFEKLIEEHNAQVEEGKRFTVGEVTIDAADDLLEDIENIAHWETFREIEEKLLNTCGGYLRVRVEGGIQYIDWVKQYGRSNSQKIRFSINLLDLRDKRDAADVFTILRPLGASEIGFNGQYGAPLTVSAVNNGLDYIQDDEAIAQYGRIWKTYTWAYETNPQKLLDKGRKYLKTGAELQTITLKAVDMHFLDGSIEAIHVGDTVHIVSEPHGIDIEKVCAKIEIDLQNPENTMYTFGEPHRTLTENAVKIEKELDGLTGYKSGGGRGGGGSIEKEASEILRWAKAQIDEANANILLSAGEINSLEGRMNKAEVEIDGLNAQILLKASQEVVTDLGARLSQAEVEIDGANAQILLKANQASVDALGSRVSAAELEIDGLNSEITLKADKVTIDAELTSINKYFAGSATAAKMIVTNLTAMGMTFDGMKCKWANVEIPTSARIPALTGYNVTLGDGSTAMIYAFNSTSRTVSLSTESMSLMKATT